MTDEPNTVSPGPWTGHHYGAHIRIDNAEEDEVAVISLAHGRSLKRMELDALLIMGAHMMRDALTKISQQVELCSVTIGYVPSPGAMIAARTLQAIDKLQIVNECEERS